MAERYLVDTGVFARWYIEQTGYQHALELRGALLAGEVELETVDCVRFELAHVLRTKGLLLRRMSREDYLAAVRTIDDLEIVVHATDADALGRAAAYAADWNMRFFDAVVVDAAVERQLTLLTTDLKLCNAAGDRISTELLRGLA